VGTSGRVKREREEDLANETSTTIDIDMNDLDPEERKALLRMKVCHSAINFLEDVFCLKCRRCI
jgi:hypothetical protein